MDWINDFINSFWALSLEMSPYLLLGFLIAGFLHGIFSKEWLQKQLGKPGWISSIKASLFGIPLPLCSCGVIPTGVSLHQKGASKGAPTSFLISTPQTGIDSIFITYGLLGWTYALIRPIIAFVTGVLGGYFVDSFDTNAVSIKETDCCSDCSTEAKQENWFRRIFKYAFVDFLQDISRWLIVGLVLASVISIIIPEYFFEQGVLSEPIVSMLIVLVASIPLYVCATGSVPIAAVLLMKGISPGSAIVFLMAGPATNIATFTVIWNTIGKRMTIIYLTSIILGAFGFGIIIDYVLPESWTSLFSIAKISEEHQHFLPYWLSFGSTIILFILILNAEIVRFIPKKRLGIEPINTQTYIIKGMTCNHCVENVRKNISLEKNIKNIQINLSSGQVEIEGHINDDLVKSIVESLGYKYVRKM